MSFIKAEKVTYRYPEPEEFSEEFADKKTQREDSEPTEAKKERPALDEASLSIEEGQFICILGRNGSGKSTLARHFNALLFPTEGSVWISGKDTCVEENVWDIRSLVGMVFQNPDNQIIGSVVDEDVAFGLENLGVPSEDIQRKVKEVLESVNMADYAKRSPNSLSGGQKQRIAVAGVLAMEPQCIVFDEATSMLDPIGREEVMKTALSLNREKGITLIVITHYMDETLNADRVFVMNKGKVSLSGTPKEVFSERKIIEEAGLKLPPAALLAEELRKKGMNIPEDIISADELVEYLKEGRKPTGRFKPE